MRTIQITIDNKTARLLDTLAAAAGSRSSVIRAAIQRMAEQKGFERYLDWLERQPGVQRSMERAQADEKVGRVVSHRSALRRARKARKT